MKTVTNAVILYSFKELSESAQAAVLGRVRERVETSYIGDEMLASFRAVSAACGLRLYDWSFGPYCKGWKAKVSGSNEYLEGSRALAWFLRILIENGYSRPKKFREMSFLGVCGFTSVCYDESICETIWESLLDGDNVSKAFDNVAGKLSRLWKDEDDYNRKDETILGYLDQSAEIYTEDGKEC